MIPLLLCTRAIEYIVCNSVLMPTIIINWYAGIILFFTSCVPLIAYVSYLFKL